MVQALDTRTGERRWVFFIISQLKDDFGADTWEDESWRFTGHANVWGLMSLDVEPTYRRAHRAATAGLAAALGVHNSNLTSTPIDELDRR